MDLGETVSHLMFLLMIILITTGLAFVDMVVKW